MPLSTNGRPAVQSSSGARASCSGIVRLYVGGNGPPENSRTSCLERSLYDNCAFSLRIACARRKRSATVGPEFGSAKGCSWLVFATLSYTRFIHKTNCSVRSTMFIATNAFNKLHREKTCRSRHVFSRDKSTNAGEL